MVGPDDEEPPSKDDPVAIPLEFEDALRALLEVDHDATVEDDEDDA